MRRLFIKIQQTVVMLSSLFKVGVHPVPPIAKFWVDGDDHQMVDGNGNKLVFKVTPPPFKFWEDGNNNQMVDGNGNKLVFNVNNEVTK